MNQRAKSEGCNNRIQGEIVCRLMNDKEAAMYLDVGLSTLRNWRSLHRGPDYIKMGRAVRYLEADLLKFLESRRIKVSG